MDNISQYQSILAHLKQGNTITQMDALTLFKCFRLAARINDMRSKGHDIKCVMKEVMSTDLSGKEVKKKVGEYSLV
jgi:hypothetical protein|tara:strand:+ start:181 stop:408 length:228 start_codon:yes stop_codon:yes gene_type:complete